MSIPKDFTKDNLSNFPVSFIFSTIYRQHTLFLKHQLEQYNVSAGEYPLIMTLYNESKKTQNELANIFYMTEGTIARTVRNLEDKGFIKREIDDNNRRRNFVFLTDEGKRLASVIGNLELEWQKEVCDFLDDDQMDLFKQILYKITIKSIQLNKK